MAKGKTVCARVRSEVPRSGTRARRLRSASLVSAGLVAVALASAVSVVSAAAAPVAERQQAGAGPVRQARVLEGDRTGIDAPAGLAFSASSKSFYVIGARGGGADTEIVRLTPFALSAVSDRAGSARVAAAIKDPANVAFDARNTRLLLLDNADRLLEVRADANGDLDPTTLVRRDALRLDLRDAQGMTVDPASGVVYVLDAAGPRIVRIEPDAAGGLDAATVSEVDLRSSGVSAARGLAFDPSTGHLHVGSAGDLTELTATGEAVTTRDLSPLGLVRPSGMAFAPTGDSTDDPAALSVYVADAGSAQGSGQIVELSLTPPAAPASIDFQSALVTTVDMGSLGPPSTDPAGITYVPSSNRLLISDSEVEETVNGITHFAGANVWELNRTGLSLARTANISNVPPGVVVPVTNEPSGAAFNPSNGHYYFAADDGKKVFDVNPGSDGLVGTAGDTVSSFDTLAAGNSDPEGVTYDTFNGHLFVADGVNREIYEYTTSGTMVNHFDTQVLGVEDPEAVEFNPVSGTLLILSDRLNTAPPVPIIVETTTSGSLVRTIDASASGAFKPAGLAYAPASDGTDVKRFYIVDRGIDNNNDPNAIDGKLYELTTPAADPPANLPPTVDAGTDQAVTLPASASLNGTVSDDGNPTPPSVTTTWTQVSGPSTVTFGNPNAEDTTASVTVAGVYVVRLTASDGQFSAFDEVTLSFTGSGSSNVFEARVAAASDDAEEIADGTVQRGDGDLDMMTDTTGTGSPKTRVGVRFTSVAIPQGAPITSAYIQFTADEADTAATSLTIRGQAAVNAPTFSTTPFDLTSRPTTTASATWTPPSWLAVGDALLAQRTSDLTGIVQEIVSQPGWASGNALVLFVTGTGERVAIANNQNPAAAALLHVEWGAGGGNAAPVITSNGGGATATAAPPENQSFVADVDATDPDVSQTLTYSISGGPDAARFAIAPTTGVLTFVSAPNFELPQDVGGNNVYDVTVSVSDGNGGSDSQTIAASVQNVNEFAPVIDGGATASVAAPENQTAATDVNATDGDGDVLTYSLTGGADIGDFTVDASTGVLTFAALPDFELPADSNGDNFYEVTVTAADASFSDTQAITVQVTDVAEGGNTPPTITSDGGLATASKSVPENTTAVTDVDATDPDAGQTLTYSTSGGPDAAKFSIVPSTGVLTFVTAPNWEAPTDAGGNNVYDVTVLVSDGNGGSDTQAIAVTVTNANEFTPVIESNGGGASAAVSAAENQTAVTDVNATDGDQQTLTYSISGGADSASFAIVPATGVLTFVTAPNFEAPTDVGTNNVYDVVVQASDGSLSDTQAIAVTVTDVNENPGSPLYFTLLDVGTVGGVTADNEDVVFFDGTSFSLAFDGSDVGLAAFRVDAFSWIDSDSLLFSFDVPGTVSGVAFDDSDVLRFDATSLGSTTAGTWSMYFDGSDVLLTAGSEDVDAVELLANGHIVISTTGAVGVTGVAEDDKALLEFTHTSLGEATAGTFTVYFDGSDVGLTTNAEDVDAAAIDSSGKIYLSTLNSFTVTGVSGADEDVFVFTPTTLGPTTSGTYSSTLYFDGSVHGLSANDLFAVDLP